MGASSVTGTGQGTAKPTTNSEEIKTISHAPTAIFAGIAVATEGITSPPTTGNSVTFPYPLAGGQDNYVVLLTSVNAGAVYIADRDEDGDGNFTGFSFVSEADGSVMYLIFKIATKPS